MGIVGLNFGRHVIDHLTTGAGGRYFRVAAVCDMDRVKGEAMAKRLGVRWYRDLEGLLSDPGVETVGLFTGPVGRADLLSQIIRAGRDVMTTKPFEIDPGAALGVLREARSLGRVIHLNSPSPVLSNGLGQLACWRDEFDLGRPIGARAEVWANYREEADGSWYDDPRRCPLAPVFRIGIYLINDLLRLFGPAAEVQAAHSRIFTGRPTPDNAQLSILFRNGALANVYSSFCVDDLQPYRNTLVMNFERGSLYRNAGVSSWSPGKGDELGVVARDAAGNPVRRRKHVREVWADYQWANFHRAIGGGELPGEATPEQIVEGLEVIAAMARAEQSGRSEKVVPATAL